MKIWWNIDKFTGSPTDSYYNEIDFALSFLHMLVRQQFVTNFFALKQPKKKKKT